MLNYGENTFVVMHEDTGPTKYMSTIRNLRSYKLFFKTYGAIELISTTISNLLDLTPLAFFNTFEIR
jgi:hypothetical protein